MEYQKVTGTDGQTYRIPIRAYDAIANQAQKTDPDKVALLEACRFACEYYEMLERATGVEHGVLKTLRAAIARATGEDEP